MWRRPSLLAALLLAVVSWAAPGLRADVVATPAWRLLGPITVAQPKDDVVYVGGTFTQLAKPSDVKDQIHELATGLVRPGCATSTRSDRGFTGVPDEQGGLIVRVNDGDAFADGNGAFAPPAGTVFVKVRTDCTFDRVFAAGAIDPTAPADLSAGRPVQSGPFVYASKTRTDAGTQTQVAVLAQYDATSGVRINYRDYATANPLISDVRLLGRAPGGQLVAAVQRVAFFGSGTYFLGSVDPNTLNVTVTALALPFEASDLSQPFWVRGQTLYRTRPEGAGVALDAYDLASFAPKAGWTAPVLGSVADLEVAGGRVFVTSPQRLADGVATALPQPAALVEATGAVDVTWTPPTLRRIVEEPTNPYTPTLTQFATDGTRLYFSGDFELVNGQQRDGVAAIAAATGQLDAWDPAPLQAVPLEYTQGGLLMSRPTGTDKVIRRYLAAVSRASGTVLPWNPNDPAVVPFFPVAPVTAIAADATWVYYATDVTGQVLRARRDTAEVDRVWNLSVKTAAGGAGRVTSLVLDGGVLYVGGQFAAVEGAAFARTARQDIFSIDVVGAALRPWAPTILGPPGREVVRAIIPLGGIVYVGGDFSIVNGANLDVFAGLDPNNGVAVTQPMFVQPDTRIAGMTTDGTSVFVAGTALGAPLVGIIPAPSRPSLSLFSVPSGLMPPGAAYLAGRLYAGREFDTGTGQVTESTVTWPKVIAAPDGLLAVNADGSGLEFFPLLTGDPPGAPTGLQASVVGNRVTFTWTAPAPSDETGEPTSYVLRVGSGPGLTDLASFDTRSLATSFVTPGPDGRFYVRVVARNPFGVSSESNEVIVQIGAPPCTGAPETVPLLTHTVAGLSTQLTWVAAPGATSYVLEAGSAPGLANLLVTDVGNVTTLGATAGAGTYHVRVRGANACGIGAASNDTTVVLGGPLVAPNAPTNLRAVVDAARNVAVLWDAPASGGTPSLYQLEAGYAPGTSDAAVARTSGTMLFAPSVPPGTYYVRVRAGNAAGAGPATSEVSVTIP